MANIPLNITVDLDSKRIVRDNNSSVGLRSYSFSEGNTYTGTISLLQSGEITSVTIEIGNETNDIALVRHDGFDENFSLSCNGDFVRQYLYGSLAKHTVLNIALSVGETAYVLDFVPCLLVANPDDNTGAVTSWESISDKPMVFPPDAHTHPATDISDSSPVGRDMLLASSAEELRSLIELSPSNSAVFYRIETDGGQISSDGSGNLSVASITSPYEAVFGDAHFSSNVYGITMLEAGQVNAAALLLDGNSLTLSGPIGMFGTGSVFASQQISSTPTSGFTLSVGSTKEDTLYYMTPAGTLAQGTLNLPANASSEVGQTIRVITTQTISNFSVAVASSGLIIGTPVTSLPANSTAAWQKVSSASNGTWICVDRPAIGSPTMASLWLRNEPRSSMMARDVAGSSAA